MICWQCECIMINHEVIFLLDHLLSVQLSPVLFLWPFELLIANCANHYPQSSQLRLDVLHTCLQALTRLSVYWEGCLVGCVRTAMLGNVSHLIVLESLGTLPMCLMYEQMLGARLRTTKFCRACSLHFVLSKHADTSTDHTSVPDV